jgi:hypothetical protein
MTAIKLELIDFTRALTITTNGGMFILGVVIHQELLTEIQPIGTG